MSLLDFLRSAPRPTGSEPGWAEFAEHAATGFYRLDRAGRLTHANRALAQLLGFSSVEALRAARGDFRTALYKDPAHARWLAKRLETQGHVRGVEAELAGVGECRWVSETVAVVRDKHGRKVGEAGILTDIGERRRAEEKYRDLVERSQDGIYVLRDGRIAYVNAVLARMVGYEPEEVIGQETERFFAPSARAQAAAVRAARAAGRREDFHYETRFLARDGKTEIPVSIHSGPFRYLGENAVLGTVRDLSLEQAGRDRAEAAEQRYRELVEQAAMGIYRSTPDGRLLDANPALVRMLGYSSLDEFRTSVAHLKDLYVVPDRRAASLAKLEAEGGLRGEELRMRRHDGSEIWLSETARVVRDESGALVCYEGMLEDISARKEAEEELHYRASHDALTGLPNRAVFDDRLAAALESVRGGAPGFAVLFADLDAVKRVNDSLGHAEGDRLLRAAAERLLEATGVDDVVCRYGSDEFTILAEGIAEPAAAKALAERIESFFTAPFSLGGCEVYTRISIGIVLGGAEYADTETVLRNADIAMASARRLETSAHVLFDHAIRSAALERLQLEADMRAGVTRNEFEMHYQPIYDMFRNRIVAFEALLRWRHPERGLLDAESFIAVAEETGLIIELGWNTLDAALAACAGWRASGYDMAVAVNLSNLQFRDVGLADKIAVALEKSGLPPQRLHLEVTERVFVENAMRARRTMLRLRALGVGLHLDDFGTGYSSLAYLSNLPFDALKIDRSFVSQLPGDVRARAIVKSILTLAKALELEVMAEGVETEEQAAILTDLDCALGQGHLFGAAMDADAALALLRATQNP